MVPRQTIFLSTSIQILVDLLASPALSLNILSSDITIQLEPELITVKDYVYMTFVMSSSGFVIAEDGQEVKRAILAPDLFIEDEEIHRSTESSLVKLITQDTSHDGGHLSHLRYPI